MKKYFFLFLSCFLLNSTFAQDTSRTTHCELKNGLQFQIGYLLQLTGFDGYTFSYRYRFDKNSGLRAGISIQMIKDDDNITQKLDSISINPPLYNHISDFKISLQYIRSLVCYKDFSLILGAGPFISYNKNEQKRSSLYSSYISNSYTKDETFGFGLDLIAGIEYKLTENIIFSGEYGLTFSKENTKVEDTYTDVPINQNILNPTHIYKQSGSSHTFSINNLGVNLGIAVFF